MNYVYLKEWCEKKLTNLKEDLVRSVNIPSNTISYTGLCGSFIINPFGANSYSFDVMFTDKDSLEYFIKELAKQDIYKEISDDTIVHDNNINKYYVVSGFINKAFLQDIQLVFKNILNSYRPVVKVVNELGAMK